MKKKKNKPKTKKIPKSKNRIDVHVAIDIETLRTVRALTYSLDTSLAEIINEFLGRLSQNDVRAVSITNDMVLSKMHERLDRMDGPAQDDIDVVSVSHNVNDLELIYNMIEKEKK